MVGRVFTLQVKPGRMDEFVRTWNQQMLPAAESQPGWLSGRLLVDRASGKVLIVGIWASEGEATAGGPGSLCANRQRDLIGDMVTGTPVIETLEVAGES